MASVVKMFSDFRPETITEGSFRSLDNGAKIVFLNHKPDDDACQCPILLQTFERRTIKGVETSDFGDGPTKHTIELALDPDDAEYKKLAEMDDAIVNLAFQSGGKWLRSKSGAAYNSLDMVRDKYTPTLRIPRDKDGNVTDRWPPTFRLTVPQDRQTGDFTVEVWDEKRNQIPPKEFIANSRNARVTVIAKCTGIWVAGNGFGVSWKAQQILVHSWGRGSNRIEPFAFIKTEDKSCADNDEFLDDSD